MAYIKWSVIIIVIAVFAAFFHYSLPQRDIARIVDTDVTRMDIGSDANGNALTRDVRFIYAKFPDDGAMEYRNEDTGWSWPLFFKFDSANLANEAADAKSTSENPRWVVIRHYGWRIPWLDMFPNAISIRPADGPQESLIPWFNIIFLVILITGVLVIRRILIILRKRHVDPVIEGIDREFDESASWWRRQWRRFFG